MGEGEGGREGKEGREGEREGERKIYINVCRQVSRSSLGSDLVIWQALISSITHSKHTHTHTLSPPPSTHTPHSHTQTLSIHSPFPHVQTGQHPHKTTVRELCSRGCVCVCVCVFLCCAWRSAPWKRAQPNLRTIPPQSCCPAGAPTHPRCAALLFRCAPTHPRCAALLFRCAPTLRSTAIPLRTHAAQHCYSAAPRRTRAAQRTGSAFPRPCGHTLAHRARGQAVCVTIGPSSADG